MELRNGRPGADESSSYYFTYIDLVLDGDIVRTLETQHAEVHALLEHTTDAKASVSPAPGEWSVKQVLQHVIDTERLFSFRAMWFARGEQTALPLLEVVEHRALGRQTFGQHIPLTTRSVLGAYRVEYVSHVDRARSIGARFSLQMWR